nr:hypothetical protein [Prescottella equi]
MLAPKRSSADVLQPRDRDEGGHIRGTTRRWIDDVALAWEIDSLDWHLSPDEYDATLARRARMQSEGIIVLAVIPRQLRDSPERALADLRAHYELARSRPRPPLRMRPRPTH